jgi:putative addiction module CopG family antidote
MDLSMNVTLTPRHKRYISAKVKSGAYGSPQEVIREGLRLLEAEDERQRRLGWLQAEVEKGFAGPITPWTGRDAERVRRLVIEHAAKGR